MSIIYISYPRGTGRVPEWWESLRSSATSAFVSYFDPAHSLVEQVSLDKNFAEKLDKKSNIDMDAFRLPPQLGGGLVESMPMIESGDKKSVAKTAVWRDLYVLMRSDLVLVDLDSHEFGDRTAEVIFAKLWNIPIIGISDRIENSAVHVCMVDAIVSSNLENLIGIIGHKLSESQRNKNQGEENEEDGHERIEDALGSE